MRIHKLENGNCVISAKDGMWLAGVYEDERAAKFAFKISESDKCILRDNSVKRGDCVITWQDIKDFRDSK